MTDLHVINEGSIFLLTAHSAKGADWIDENLPDDVTLWGNSVVVEHRYIEDIVRGALADGLEIS